MDIWDIFGSKGAAEVEVLAGPSSRKRLPKDMSLLDAKLNITVPYTEKGTDYVASYVQKEEEELLEV